MGHLIIERNSEWNNKTRKIRIFIDGKKIGTITDGETMNYDLEPGIYELQAKIDWCSSKKTLVSISENERKTFNLSGFKNGSWITLTGLGLMLTFFLLQIFFHFELKVIIIIAAPFLILPFYYITIGRSKYLKLTTEIDNNNKNSDK